MDGLGSNEGYGGRPGTVAASPYGLPPGYPGQTDASRSLGALDLLAVFRRRFRLIALTVAVLTGLSAVIAANLTPHYQANALVLLNTGGARVLPTASVIEDQPPDKAMVDTQMRVLRSRSFARTVIEKLDLLNDPAFARPPPSGGSSSGFFAGLLGSMSQTLLAATEDGRAAGSGGSADGSAMSYAVSRLLGGLQVSQEGQSSIISVGYRSPDARFATAMANQIAKLYIQTQLSTKEDATDRAASWLKRRVEELRQKVLESENAVARYRAQNQLRAGTRLSLDEQRLSEVNAALIEAKAAVAEKESKFALIRRMRREDNGLVSVSEVLNSPVIGALRQEELRLLKDEALLLQEYGPRHPKIIEIQAQKKNLAAKIDLELANIMGVLENELAIALARRDALEQSLEQAKQQQNVRDQAEVQLNELQREADANRTLYTSFLSRYKELGEQRDLLEAGARIISNAVVPTEPSFPQPRFIVAVGFTSSVMLGALLALVRESLEQGLRSPRQLEQELGLSSFGSVPNINKLQKGQRLHRYLIEKPKSAYAEAIRNIWVSLQLSRGKDMPRVILVSSSLPNEGKTTLATSLAASLATGGHETVLIDLDLRNPSVAGELSLPPSWGLVEYLAGERAFEEIVVRDQDVANLDIVPVVQIPGNPVDLLGSSRIEDFVTELRGLYDYVIIDSPPILGITDTKIMTRLADVVLLAVRWGATKADVARNAVETLMSVAAPLGGAVLTRVDLKRHASLAYGDAAQYYKKYKTYYVD